MKFPTVENLRSAFLHFCHFYVFQHEVGALKGLHHFQARVKTKKRLSASQVVDHLCAQLDSVERGKVHAAPESKNGLTMDAGLFYTTKIESRFAGPWCDYDGAAPCTPVRSPSRFQVHTCDRCRTYLNGEAVDPDFLNFDIDEDEETLSYYGSDANVEMV